MKSRRASMTTQEAVKLIKRLYYEEDYCLVPELAEALDLAMEALERQDASQKRQNGEKLRKR